MLPHIIDTPVWPVLSHLGAFLAGGLTWWWITLREGRLLSRDAKETPMPLRRHLRVIHHRLPIAAVALLTFGALMVGFGVQQYLYQQQQDERDACYDDWGQSLVETATESRRTTLRLQDATTARDEALDNIVLIIIGLREEPPRFRETDFARTLQEFAEAKARLSRVQDRTEQARTMNPYPALDCQ